MAITIDDFDKIWASTSPLTPYSFGESNYKEGWNFIGSTPPSRQMWDFIQKQNDEKLKYIVDNYLPTAGGTMTGNIILPNGSKAISEDDIFYKAGDTEDFDTFCANGNITTGAKEMRFSVFTPKRLDKINGVTITLMKGGIRVPAGGYIDTDGTNLLTKYSCGASKNGKNLINVYLSSSSAISGATNNTPIAFWVHVTFSFS